jgi:hypothetical protein
MSWINGAGFVELNNKSGPSFQLREFDGRKFRLSERYSDQPEYLHWVPLSIGRTQTSWTQLAALRKRLGYSHDCRINRLSTVAV